MHNLTRSPLRSLPAPSCPCRSSTVPTAFTGYSFHVVEAVIVFANEVLVCYLLPIHLGLHRAYHLFTTVIHQGGAGRAGRAVGGRLLGCPRGAADGGAADLGALSPPCVPRLPRSVLQAGTPGTRWPPSCPPWSSWSAWR